jgi:hypothetical protein
MSIAYIFENSQGYWLDDNNSFEKQAIAKGHQISSKNRGQT